MTQSARASALQNSKALEGPKNILDLIGNTALLRLGRMGAAFPGVEICAKAEVTNI